MTTKQEQWQHKAVDEAPISCKGILARAYSGKAAPRQAIKACCLRCVGYVRSDVSGCTAWACPLHQYRPFQAGEDDPADAEASGLEVKDASVAPG